MNDHDPSKYDNRDLLSAFQGVDRNMYPDRYELLCKEMDKRGIPYQNLSQMEREDFLRDQELEAMGEVGHYARNIYFFIVGAIAFLTYLYNEFIK